MKTFAIYNQKGGSGKTVLTILVSAYLVAARKKVLCVDMDPQGSLSAFISRFYEMDFAGESSYEVMNGTASRDGAITGVIDGLSVIHSSRQLVGVEGSASVKSLSKFLSNVAGFDYCLIDTAGTWNMLIQSSFEAADEIIVPTLPNSDDLENAIWSTKQSNDFDRPARVVLNRWKETKFNREGLELYGPKLEKYLAKNPLPESPLIPRYTDTGERLTAAKGKMELVEAIGKIVNEIFDKKAKATEI